MSTTPTVTGGMMSDKCFACGRRLLSRRFKADTRDDQIVDVGPDCYTLIQAAGEPGYQPPKGGPRLWKLNESAFPRHDYFYHGIFTDCGVCSHPAQCVRLQEIDGSTRQFVCRACVAESEAPEDLTLEMWCTECAHTVPVILRSENWRAAA